MLQNIELSIILKNIKNIQIIINKLEKHIKMDLKRVTAMEVN